MEVGLGVLFDVPSTVPEAVPRGPRRGPKFRDPLAFDLAPRVPGDGIAADHLVCKIAEAVASRESGRNLWVWLTAQSVRAYLLRNGVRAGPG